MENKTSVLVSAHTSAGKTVVAQYAIAKALKENQRVIYTSPIKALSNQKYRELEQEFKDVGLMTGDVTLNPNATCLVMTTEILRNMLYKGSNVTREMGWVIFDEVHYMRDKDRGVVWEETIILLPNIVNYVFLSATIPNANQFAQWICRIKKQPCNVVSTSYRPVPLQHYVYPSGSEGIYLVVDKKGTFKEENFNKAVTMLEDDYKLSSIHSNLNKDNKSKNKSKKNSQENNIKKLLQLIKDSNLYPAIVFSFSKRDCESNAQALSKLDLTIPEEKDSIELIYNNAIKSLSEDDQNLPQIQHMLPLLKIGVGIHHGGLLPIVKEIVELLFQEGLVKVLFSTETFSMGINMPAKTVVFTSIEKFDGEKHRFLGGGEYIQMSGRAGRRGLDDIGITIMMITKKINTEVCKAMLSGQADALFSSFKLSYNMIVNLMRIEGLSPDFIVKQSFRQFQSEANVPELIDNILNLKDELYSIKINSEDETLCSSIEKNNEEINKNKLLIKEKVFTPVNLLKYLIKGRLVKIKNFGWGIFLKVQKKDISISSKVGKSDIIEEDYLLNNNNNNNKGYINKDISLMQKDKYIQSIKNLQGAPISIYLCDVMLFVLEELDINKKLQPVDFNKILNDRNSESFRLGVIPVSFNCIDEISELKINIPDKIDLDDSSIIKSLENKFYTFYKIKYDVDLCPMHPSKIINLNQNNDILQIIEKNNLYEKNNKELFNKLNESYNKYNITNNDNNNNNNKKSNNNIINSTNKDSLLSVHYNLILNKYKKKEDIRYELHKQIDKLIDLKETVLNEELQKRKKVLRSFDFVNSETVRSKGQVACLLSSADEIVLTEMLFNSQFNDVEPEYLAAVLSCFLTEERGKKNDKEIEFKDIFKNKGKLKELHNKVLDYAKKVSVILKENRLNIDENNYVSSFKCDLMEVVYAWASNKKFSEIMELTEDYEGNVIRVIRRLDELIKQVSDCAMLIGNNKLKSSLNTASEKIKRGIIFAASLYLEDGK